MSVLIQDLVVAVRDDLALTPGIRLSTGYDNLTEAINEFPLVQVYPESGEVAHRSRTDRTTFGAVLRQEQMVLHVDVFAQQRFDMAHDMMAVIDVADAVRARLESHAETPPFGVTGVDTWRWTWTRVIFEYGDPRTQYVGIRFILSFTMHN